MVPYIPCITGISCQWYTVSKDYRVGVGLYEWYHICPVALEYVVPGVLFLRSKVSPDIILCGCLGSKHQLTKQLNF